jgi:predicted PurR-regulated permease PerM
MMRRFNDIGFGALLLAISLLFGWILWPFFGAILWAVVVAIVFMPLNDRIVAAMPDRPTLAALLTLLAILLIVILPALAIGMSLVRQGADLYTAVQNGRIDLPDLIRRLFGSLPVWVTDFAGRYGIYEPSDLQERLVAWATASTQFIAGQAVTIGQGTFGFVVDLAVMLYLLFFLLRDGHGLAAAIETRLPLEPTRRRALLDKVSVVVRATVKGGLLIALLQGALGGFIFWALGLPSPLLWAALMAFLSLVPALGAGLVWAPVAIYLIGTGDLVRGLGLVAWGVVVIGLADNLLRPMMVGKDVKLPDYLILVSTLGGLQMFGLNGFVIGPLVAALFVACWRFLGEAPEVPRNGQTADQTSPVASLAKRDARW